MRGPRPEPKRGFKALGFAGLGFRVCGLRVFGALGRFRV